MHLSEGSFRPGNPHPSLFVNQAVLTGSTDLLPNAISSIPMKISSPQAMTQGTALTCTGFFLWLSTSSKSVKGDMCASNMKRAYRPSTLNGPQKVTSSEDTISL